MTKGWLQRHCLHQARGRNGLVAAICVLLMFGISVTACAPTYSQNIEVTVSVDDHGTVRTGSSVFKFVCQESNRALGEMGLGKCLVYGEAVAVDLKSKGYLIVPIRGSEGDYPDDFISAVMANRSNIESLTWKINPSKLLFIKFANKNFPSTVLKVNPEDMSKSFGYGVSLGGIKAEVTKKKVEFGKIDNVLPWLQYTKKMINGTSSIRGNGLYDRLDRTDFKSGFKK